MNENTPRPAETGAESQTPPTDQGLDPGLPAMKALGVPELARHLAAEITLDEAADAAKQATCNFAKRQMTWLRNQVDPDLLIEAPYTADLRERVVASVRGFLADTGH